MTHEPKRLLAVNLNYLGDALFTTPALAYLRARFPHTTMDVLAGGRAPAILGGNDAIDRLIVRPPHGGSGRAAALARTLRDGKYDAVVLFQPTFSNALIARASRVPVRVGFAQDGCGPLLTHAVPPQQAEEHVVDAYTRLAHALDGSPAKRGEGRLSVDLTEADRAFAQQFLCEQNLDGPKIGLVIGATRPQKRWPEEYFARLADKLAQCGVRSVLLGGPDEAPSAQRIMEQARFPLVSAVGQTTEKQLAALIERLGAVVSGDSGPLHIATAMNTPVVALFGSTNPAETGPWRPSSSQTPAIVLYDALPCAPCRKNPTCGGRFDCLRVLTPERVFDAVGEVLELPASRHALTMLQTVQPPPPPVPEPLSPFSTEREPAPIPPVLSPGRFASVFAKPPLPAVVRSLLILTKHHYMGDTIVAVPMLRAARQAFPDAYITLVTGRQAAVALEHCDLADRMKSYNPHEPGFDAHDLYRDLLTHGTPDLCLIADRSFRSARIAWRTGARVRAGFASEYRGFLLTHRVAYRPDQPETECILDVLRAVAPDDLSHPYDSRPALCLTTEERERGREILAKYSETGAGNRVLVGVQPGANYAAKQWDAKKFACVAQALATDYPEAAIVLLGKGEAEANAAQALKIALPSHVPVVDLTDATGLRETMAVLSHLRLFIGNDTGVNHLAAALGVPTVGLFGPTSAAKWGNTARLGLVVAAPEGDLSQLEVAPVLEAARKLLVSPPPPREPARVGVPV